MFMTRHHRVGNSRAQPRAWLTRRRHRVFTLSEWASNRKTQCKLFLSHLHMVWWMVRLCARADRWWFYSVRWASCVDTVAVVQAWSWIITGVTDDAASTAKDGDSLLEGRRTVAPALPGAWARRGVPWSRRPAVGAAWCVRSAALMTRCAAHSRPQIALLCTTQLPTNGTTLALRPSCIYYAMIASGGKWTLDARIYHQMIVIYNVVKRLHERFIRKNERFINMVHGALQLATEVPAYLYYQFVSTSPLHSSDILVYISLMALSLNTVNYHFISYIRLFTRQICPKLPTLK